MTIKIEHRRGFMYEPLSDKYVPIKPCPFCGCEDLTIVNAATIKCTNCGARGPDWFYREQLSIPDWNDRNDN